MQRLGSHSGQNHSEHFDSDKTRIQQIAQDQISQFQTTKIVLKLQSDPG